MQRNGTDKIHGNAIRRCGFLELVVAVLVTASSFPRLLLLGTHLLQRGDDVVVADSAVRLGGTKRNSCKTAAQHQFSALPLAELYREGVVHRALWEDVVCNKALPRWESARAGIEFYSFSDVVTEELRRSTSSGETVRNSPRLGQFVYALANIVDIVDKIGSTSCVDRGQKILMKAALLALTAYAQDDDLAEAARRRENPSAKGGEETQKLRQRFFDDPGVLALVDGTALCALWAGGAPPRVPPKSPLQGALALHRARVDRSGGGGGTIRLLSGGSIPMVGLGTGYGDCYVGSQSKKCKSRGPTPAFYAKVFKETSIRLVDSAALYGTEVNISAGIRQSGLAPDSVFFMTKPFPGEMLHSDDILERMGPKNIELEPRLRAMKRSHVDAYVLHDGPYEAADWERIWELKAQGLVRAVGVTFPEFQPGIDIIQTRLSPCVSEYTAEELKELAQQNVTFVVVELIYCTRDPVVVALAEMKGISSRVLLYKWASQLGLPFLMQSRSIDHLTANLKFQELEDLTDYEFGVLGAAISGDYADL